jgi:hypothetical protein
MTEETIREDTMLYRVPAKDTDPSTIHNIWGRDLETCTVDASEVEALKKERWVSHPSHIDNPPKPEEAAGFVPDRGKADAELKAAHERIAALESDLKAASELADAESKAKDEALARLKALESYTIPEGVLQSAKPTLGVKGK